MKVRHFTQLLTFLCFVVFAQVVNAGFMFSASLGGDQEIPPVATDASGIAMAELTGTSGSYVLTYQIDYMDLSSPIIDVAGGGHFHNAPAGANGGVVHLFDTDTFAFLGTTQGSIVGEWRYDDVSNPLTDMLANELTAGNIYINLHTENFASGELRGQLRAVSAPSVLLLFGLALAFLYRRQR